MSYMYKRENGTWYAAISKLKVIRAVPEKHSKPRYIWKRLSLHTTDKSEAKETFALLIAAQKSAGLKNILKEITLRDYFNTVYLDKKEFFSVKKHSSQRTHEETKYILDKFLKYLNNDSMLLSELTEEMIEGYKMSRKETVANATINRQITAIKGALTYAVKKKLLTASPAKNVEMLSVPTRQDIKYLDETEIKDFLAACRKHYTEYFPLYFFYVATGCRRLEGINLLWDDVDYEHRIITIQSKKENKDLGIDAWNPKDYERREIRVHQELINALKALSRKNLANNPYVFSIKGKRPSEEWISRLFRIILKKAGINKDVSLHGLRHSYAVWNLKKGNVSNLEALRQLLGHSSYKTVQIYTRFALKDIQESSEQPKFW